MVKGRLGLVVLVGLGLAAGCDVITGLSGVDAISDSSAGGQGGGMSGMGGSTGGSGGSGPGGATNSAGGGGGDPCGDSCQPSEVCDGYGHCVSGTPDSHLVLGDAASFQRAWSVAVRSASDDVLVAGSFEGSVMFSNVVTALDRSAFTLLLNPGFSIVWETTVDGVGGDETAYAVSTDSAGNAILTGDYSGLTPLAQGIQLPAQEGGLDAFVAKLRPQQAAAAFAMGWGGAAEETAVQSTIGNNDDIYVCGHFATEIDLPAQTIPSSNQIDAFVVRLNSSGAEQWYQRLGGDGDQRIHDIAFQNGRLAIAGAFENEVFLGTLDTANTNNHNSSSGFVSVLDEGGTVTQLIPIGQDNDSDDVAHSITFDANGDMLVAGQFTGTVDFDGAGGLPAVTAQGRDMFLLKFSPAAALLNAITFGGSSTDELYDVEVDADGNIVMIGASDSNDLTIGGTSLSSNGNYDAIILKLNRDFEVLWSQRFGGIGNDAFLDVDTDSMSRIYAVGYISSAIQFGPVTTSHAGGEDIFIARLLP